MLEMEGVLSAVRTGRGDNRDSSEREQRWGSSQPDCQFMRCLHSK